MDVLGPGKGYSLEKMEFSYREQGKLRAKLQRFLPHELFLAGQTSLEMFPKPRGSMGEDSPGYLFS